MTETPAPAPEPKSPAETPTPPASIRAWQLVAILVLTWAAVLGAFVLPAIRGDGVLAELAYWVSFTGKEALVVVAALGTGLVISGARLSERRPTWAWGFAGMLAAAFVVGGGALFNEVALKRTLAVPRPFVKRLAAEGHLGMSPKEFYGLGDKEARRAHLRKVLTPAVTPDLSERLRAHWVVETGYSFPSGHSYAATSCAALFLAWGLLLGVTGWRRVALGLLLPWGLAVCYSRPMLGVHSPTDVTVGCALGFTFGAAAAYGLWRLTRPAP
jgi:phosphatidylglycerophosphatase B